ncbi:hypothetical protein Plhal710r2_c033g0121951 [Plasmopara halstedii]
MNFVRFTLVTAAVVDLLACTNIRTPYEETQQEIRNLNAAPSDVTESAAYRLSNGFKPKEPIEDDIDKTPSPRF